MRRQHLWWTLVALGVLTIVAGAAWWYFARMHVFRGVEGPTAATPIAEPVPAKVEDFEKGGPHRLAILVTDRNSGWLGLVRGLKSHGVPFTLTTDPERALKHHVVLVYPIISGRALTADALRALAEHVHTGHTVIATNLAGGGLEALFGISEAHEGKGRSTVEWPPRDGAEPEDLKTRVSGKGDEAMGTVAYTASTAEVIGKFDDGSAAITCRKDVGRACLIGVDVGAFAQRAMNGRGESIGRRFRNGYEPSLDTLFRWLRDVYLADEPMPWRYSTVPGDRPLAIVVSHDIDFRESVENSVEYAASLAKRGVRGTFFVQVKYMRDYNEAVFFDEAAVATLKRIAASGMEIASHTIAHANTFKKFDVGTGRETYPAYQPRVTGWDSATGGTVMGETRVSKFLIENLVGTPVRSFRPGYLSYPFSLPQVLQATGYLYSSSITADSTETHLPFQLTYDRGDIALAPVYEFPVTIEDEEAPKLGDRFDAANKALKAIARNQGVAVVLVHPNITDHKLRFVERLVDEWKPNAWIGTLAELGDWWSARDGLEADVEERGGEWVLEASARMPVRDLVVLTPKAPRGSAKLALEPGMSAQVPLRP